MNTDRFSVFADSMMPPLDDFLTELEAWARENFVPVVRPATARLIQSLVISKQPKRILEIGTAVGYSGTLMLKAVPEAELVTIESYDVRVEQARGNFEKAGVVDRVTLIAGDANAVLPTLTGTFDMIFVDAAKGQYIAFWPEVKRLCGEHGMVVTDNVLFEGVILESKFSVERRDRTIHKRMREYLYELCHDEDFSTGIIPIEDGVAISARK